MSSSLQHILMYKYVYFILFYFLEEIELCLFIITIFIIIFIFILMEEKKVLINFDYKLVDYIHAFLFAYFIPYQKHILFIYKHSLFSSFRK